MYARVTSGFRLLGEIPAGAIMTFQGEFKLKLAKAKPYFDSQLS